MEITTRKAQLTDIPQLIRIRKMAHGGFNEALFEGLDQSVDEIIETEMIDSNLDHYYRNYWVAVSGSEVAGGIHVIPWDDMDHEFYNPVVPKERLVIETPFEQFEAPGSFYIHALSVFPEYTRRGIASILLSLARDLAIERGLSELSLDVFAKNTGALSLYEKYGYREIDRQPLIPHPQIIYTGDVIMMTCPV